MHPIQELLEKINIENIEAQISNFDDIKSHDFSSPEYIESLKKYNSLIEIKELYLKINKLISDLNDTSNMLSDSSLKDLAEAEIESIKLNLDDLYSKLEILLAEPLEHDEKKAIFEIRPGVGGVEAALFADDLFNMYQKYCLNNKMKIEIFSISYNNEGGINEVTFIVDKTESYGLFRFESGVHRVQRVPKTETLGRVHTSTASVVVMPEINSNSMQINPSDLRIDVYRSSGPGGQSVNTTDSAVRITHLPSKLTVTCQTSKSQHTNKEMAMTILVSRLKEIEDEKVSSQLNSLRNDSIMGGKRSSKIRTYNYSQGRITDHRIGKSWFNINNVIYEGDLQEILDTTNKVIRTGQTLSEDDIDD